MRTNDSLDSVEPIGFSCITVKRSNNSEPKWVLHHLMHSANASQETKRCK